MLLNTEDGIKCDQCGCELRDDFIYYSVDFYPIVVNKNRIPKLPYDKQSDISIDLCQLCLDKIAKLVEKHYKPVQMNRMRECPRGIHCELSGTKMIGSYTFYFAMLTKIEVNMSGATFSCSKCGTPGSSGPCTKCGETTMEKVAMNNIEKRFLELWIAEDTFTKIMQTSKNLTSPVTK